MKKLMTSVIILLPLLILAILLVSGAILSLITHIYVESVEFVDSGALVLRMEDETAPPTKQLEVNVLPLKAGNRGLVYTVENENVATVDENGVVTARFYGETYITVTSAENKAASAKRAVVVTDVSVHKLELGKTGKPDLYEGETQELSVTVYPKEATNKTVLWSSSDESILRVGANGAVTAVGAGDATVTAVSEDNPNASVSVVIRCHKKLVDLEVDQTLVVTSLKESAFPEVKPIPADADVTLSYKTDDPSVATVDKDGRVFFLKEGHAVVTVTATDFGGKSVEKRKEYTSTDGYFLPPLFAQKEFTVDYDDYEHGEALPIPFADSLEDSYREFIGANYTVENVLAFDKETKSFRFLNPMPAGTKTIKAEITARVYSAEQRASVEYEDYFYLTVLRNAEKIAVSYLETADAAAITIAEKTFSLSMGGSEGTARVTVLPENHTDELSYALASGEDVAELSGATLSFRRPGEAAVKIFCKAEDAVTAEKTLRVIYAPQGEGEKKVVVLNGQKEDGTLVLTMESETDRQTGVLYYTEPAGATVEYAVEADGDPAAELIAENGARRIAPVRGGFATVTITAASETLAAQTYSVRVYVDCPVTAEDLTVTLGGKPCANNYCTTAESADYLLTVSERNASMAGKKLFVSYQDKKEDAEENILSHSGTIAFQAELSSLAVTFGVEYGETAKEFGADGPLPTVTRTVKRNADSVSFSYQGTHVGAVTTTSTSLSFTTDADPATNKVNMTILPANHTETLEYSLTAGQNDAKITAGGVLTFNDASKACNVTVRIGLRGADGELSLTKEIEVGYAPRNEQDKVVSLPEGDKTDLLLFMSETGKADKGKIDFIEPEGATVKYQANGDVVKVEMADNRWTIIPQKGGFDVVTVTVSGTEEKTYTVNVYVDRAVSDRFSVKLNGKDSAEDDIFATTQTSVPFEVTLDCGEGAMVGKQFYVKYGGEIKAAGTEGSTDFSGSVEFSKESGALSVEFGVRYTADAERFSPEGGLGSVTRTFERNAEEISATYGGVRTVKIITPLPALTFDEGQSGSAFVSVTVSPTAHTDTLSYALDGGNGIATLSNGKLTFSAPGTVGVKLLMERDGEVTLQKTVTVTYEPLGKNEKAEIKNDSTEPLNVLLPSNGAEGVIYLTEPEGSAVEYEVTAGADTVVCLENKNGVRHIVPVGGGFATVKITVSPAAARTAERKEYTVETYVDLPVKAGDFEIKFNGGPCGDKFRTSLESVRYSVTVADDNGSTNGKKLYVTAGGVRNEASEGVLLLAGDLDLKSDTLTVTFGVDYGERAAAFGARSGIVSVTRTVSTSRGALDADPTVTYQDGTLKTGSENTIEFADIGDEIAFTVQKSFSPADFDLSKNLPSIASTAYVKASVSADGETITLTALKPCKGEAMSLAIGSKTFVLSVTVHAKADMISVTCGEKELNGSQRYDTLLGALTFHATIGREDGVPVDNKGIEYSLDGDTWQKTDETGSAAADISKLAGGLLRFRSADQGASCEIAIEKVLLEEFGLEFSVRNSGGADVVFGKIPTVLGAEELSFAVPSDMQGSVTVKVLPKRTDLLGGFGTTEEEFRTIVPIDLSGAENWGSAYVPEAGQIVLSNVKDEFRKTVKITCGEKTVSVEFSRINLARIEFTGFDSNNTVNGGDVYKGYQQARMFAKQSVYGGKEVDYFRMPVQALNKTVEIPTEADQVALSNLVWKFTGYNDRAKTNALVTVQSGNTVKYLNAEYRVADLGGGQFGLQTADGTTVVGADGKYLSGQPRVTWVDAFSEADEGYVRIYFGGFTGLSEVDVQNDYFGNFGEKADWTPVQAHTNNYDGSGRNFEPSEGAFSYLRLEGGDGAEGGINRHFNFNVLEGSDLYNIFDATGYFNDKHRKVVLQNNLYAQDELSGTLATDAENNDLILDQGVSNQDDSRITKDLIYGNGHQVNVKVLNAAIKDSQLYQGAANTSAASHFGMLYNVTLKGNNPHDDIEPKKDRMFFVIAGAYYSNIQYYTKLNISKAGTIKNTVLRYVASAAVQLYYADDSAFLENVVIAECLKGLTFENSQLGKDEVKQMYSFKGFFDVLNYYNANNLKAAVAKLENGSLVAELFPFFVDSYFPSNYAEWFGKTTDYEGFDKLEGKYINIAIYSSRGKTYLGATPLRYWDGSGYGITDPANEAYQLTIALEANFIGWTYKNTIAVDGGRKNGSIFERDMSKLFDAGDSIRLLCQYSDQGVKNTEHIQWHMNKVHRDTSLIEGWEDDHIAALKQSLKNARAKDWDGVWPDGSTLSDAGVDAAAAIRKLLSETVLPSKRTY